MKCHIFEVRDAEKYGVNKAILLHHLKYHMDSNQEDEEYLHGGKVWAFAKLESLEKMYPYFTNSSISRWLKELETDGIVKSRKPGKNRGKHLKYYTVLNYSPRNSQNGKSPDGMETGKRANKDAIGANEVISQNEKSNSQNGKSTRDNKESSFSQNGKSSIVNNNKFNRDRESDGNGHSIIDRVKQVKSIEDLYDIYKEHRRQKGRYPTLFEEEATKHQLIEWGIEKSKLIITEAIRNGWMSLKEDYLPDSHNQEFQSEGIANAGAYEEYAG